MRTRLPTVAFFVLKEESVVMVCCLDYDGNIIEIAQCFQQDSKGERSTLETTGYRATFMFLSRTK